MSTSTNIFESARLSYRGIFDEDIDANFPWLFQSEQLVGSQGGSLVPLGADTKERTKARLKDRPLCVLAVEKGSENVVALVTLRNGVWPMEYEISLNVKKESWGKGYGTEITTWVVNHAFCWMTGVHRVKIGAYSSNAAALAIYKKVGFVVEGVTRKVRFAAGKWEDHVEMSILEEEWRDRLEKS